MRAVAKPIGGSKARKPPRPEELVYGCAKQLESLNQVALDQIRGGSPNGLVVEYRQLPEVRERVRLFSVQVGWESLLPFDFCKLLLAVEDDCMVET